MKPFFRFLFALVLMVVAFSLILWSFRREPPPEDGPVSGWQEVASPRFRMTYKVPPHWQSSLAQETDALDGWNGFVQVSAFSDGVSLEDALQLEVQASVNPYGSNADVRRLEIDGQPAILVLPSNDQPRIDRRSVLLVAYPATVSFRGESYSHLILWADRDHIEDIALTLRFVSGDDALEGRIEGRVTIDSSLSDALKSRKIVVFAADGTTMLKTIDIAADGSYAVPLPPGTYVIDINHIGFDRVEGFPRTVTIEPGKTLRLDVAIDTGIK